MYVTPPTPPEGLPDFGTQMLTGMATTRQIPDSKLLTLSIYDILTQISNDFQRSLCHVQFRQTVTG